MALSMALLLSVKFHKSCEVTLVSSYVCSNSPTVSAMIKIKFQWIFFLKKDVIHEFRMRIAGFFL